ncbi:GNAT family N-acetyltransferase [Photobacterium japonica]|uniref:GNAT family N-acetyltransferase n=1 Tax=Photobacterium japonica TaxID=2910235 RepID=UPI003D126AC4
MIPTLQGVRLTLRPIMFSDREDLFAIYGNAEVMKYTDEPPFPTLETVDQMLASVTALERADASYEWAITLVSDGASDKSTDTRERVITTREKMIGTCGLHSFNDDRTQCEVGCMLNAHYWRQGYMTEALQVLMDHAATLGITELWAEIDAANVASISLFTHLGFMYQGVNDQDCHLYSRDMTAG